MLQGLVLAALLTAASMAGYLVYRRKLRRASELPTEVLARLITYCRFLELDVIQRDKLKATMTAAERKELRVAQEEFYCWKRRLPKREPERGLIRTGVDVEALETLLDERRAADAGGP